ncbi:MAG: acylneuraminate cytidylyltransferase family protein, partial [Chloroflexi bacterium]|nr:acylneuraminate cytidylyltransferase family protein [Chloroflexota bacterium]
MMRVLGIIPARGGSKGVVRKNIREVAGRPLITFTIDAAHASQMLTRCVVSTDDKEIAEISASLGCEVMNRPSELAQDDTPTISVIKHV